jgi:hypothetical protein
MSNDKQLEQLSNLANDVENLLDKIERRTGFQNILKKIHSCIPESIDNNLSNINLNDGYKLSDYRISIYHDFWDIIRFVKDNIDAINEYENDNEDKKQERNIKQNEFYQFTFAKDKVVKRTQHYGVKTWLEEETEEDPNWIYSCHGTYTKYLSKKSHWYYPICLNLALSNSNLDFEVHNGYVLLYIAVNNELKSLIAVLDILGIGNSVNQVYQTTTPKLKDSTNNNTININHNSMNYKLIILNAYTEHREQKTSYKSYFKREAQIANRDNFVEFADYFNGCQYVLVSYKKEITNQYNNRLTEYDWVVTSVKSGKGIKIENEVVTDESDKRIQDHLEYIAKDKEFVQNRGYVNNYDYPCYLNETGEITNDIWERSNDRKIFWQDIVQIEQGVNQAKEELLVQNSANLQPKSLQDNTISEPLSEFEGFLLTKDQTIISRIVEIISNDIKNSKSKNLTVALFTVALQKKSYLSTVLNKTQYHKALVGLFGENAGTRAKFNEKFNEIMQELYEKNLDEYIKRLP